MHIRLLAQTDIKDLVDMVYEVYDIAQYAAGSGPLAVNRVTDGIYTAVTQPEHTPCFVHDAPDGSGLSGFLYAHVVAMAFGGEQWLREQVFYVRPKHRSLALATSFIQGVEEWCREHGIARVELGNGVSQDPGITRLYKRLGYDPMNTIYARRL